MEIMEEEEEEEKEGEEVKGGKEEEDGEGEAWRIEEKDGTLKLKEETLVLEWEDTKNEHKEQILWEERKVE